MLLVISTTKSYVKALLPCDSHKVTGPYRRQKAFSPSRSRTVAYWTLT